MLNSGGLNSLALIACSVAILVTVVGGSWQVSTTTPANWKIYIQLPDNFVAYSATFFVPLRFLASPAGVCILTILINSSCYYALLRATVFMRRKLKSNSVRT